MDGWLRSYEQAQVDVTKLKQLYLGKVRKADEAEDEYVVFLANAICANMLTSFQCEIRTNKQPTNFGQIH